MQSFKQYVVRCVAILAVALVGCAAPKGPGGAEVRTETFMIPAADPGIQLHVRNKHAAGQPRFTSDKVMLFVHGATYPSETAFDLDLPGGSWMDIAARRGFDVYLLDIRGYGRSTRPAAMDAPPAANPPFADTADAVRDIGAAVEFIRKRRGVERLNLIGWSWGTAIMSLYTTRNNDKVSKLVLYAPVWLRQTPSLVQSGPGGVVAYRTVTIEAARQRWLTGVASSKAAELIPAGWFDAWAKANLEADADGAKRTPPVIRAPNGVVLDNLRYWSAGKPLFDPADIRVPTLLIKAEWDVDTPAYMAQGYFPRLTNAPYKRYIEIGEGTHTVMMERNRMQLFREVQHFLDEPK